MSTMNYLKPIAIMTGFLDLNFMRNTPCQVFIYKGFGAEGCATIYGIIGYMSAKVKFEYFSKTSLFPAARDNKNRDPVKISPGAGSD